jgi:hypothetical protein
MSWRQTLAFFEHLSFEFLEEFDVSAMTTDQDASKWYNLTAMEYSHGYGCTIVSTGQKIRLHLSSPRANSARRYGECVTCDALAVAKPI